jgi:hypothetical protein
MPSLVENRGLRRMCGGVSHGAAGGAGWPEMGSSPTGEPTGNGRELAKQSPDLVRLVITLGSPFTGHPRETNAWLLHELASGDRIDAHENLPSLRIAPPVPTTSIWSPTERRRILALQRRDPGRPGGEHRRRLAPRPTGACCGALRHRRPPGPAGRPMGPVPSSRLAEPSLFRLGTPSCCASPRALFLNDLSQCGERRTSIRSRGARLC